MKPSNLWITFFLLLLAACNEDVENTDKETDSITFSSTIQPAVATSTEDESWTDMLDRRIAVQIEGTVKKYMPDAEGDLISTDPFYWEGRKSITVNAWYPYNNGVKPEKIIVKAKQNIESHYQASNIMEAVANTVAPGEAKLTFVHRTTKLACALTTPTTKATTRASALSGARISLLNLQGVETGTTVNMTSNNRAYILPQTIPAGTEFMEIKLLDGRTYIYVMEENFVPEEAHMYDMELDVDPETGKVDLTIKESSSWDGSDEDIKTDTPVADSDGNGSWEGNGEGENMNGNSSDTNPEGNGLWEGNGEEENMNGNSSDANPEGNGSWEGNGEGENINGNSPDANPEGNGSWEGDEETIDGNKENY